MKKYACILLLILLGLLLQNCTYRSLMQQSSSPITYLALGDSYTIGQSVPGVDNFPHQLAGLLNIKNPQIIAVTGWTTADLLQAIAEEKPGNDFALVTLLIGVNNQYQQKPLEQYKTELEILIKKAIAHAGNKPGHVIMISIPDYGVTPFAANSNREKIARELDVYNAINKEMAGAYGLLYADITPISRQADPTNTLLAEDGLHPSGAQYKEWVNVILPLAEKVLGRTK